MVQEYFITFPHPLHYGTRVLYYIPHPLHHGTRVQYTPTDIHYMYFPSKKGLPSAIGKWHNKVCPLLKGGGGGGQFSSILLSLSI